MNVESVKARLKNFAVGSGCTFQDALVYYGLERTIYRLSISPYDHLSSLRFKLEQIPGTC